MRVHHPCYTEADLERMSDREYDDIYEEFVVELVTHRSETYQELLGRKIDNAPLRKQRFGEVVERVRFRLDEGGALLRTEAVGRGLCLPPRELLCHSPFLVMVLRRGAKLPMFALWVDTTELLLGATMPK